MDKKLSKANKAYNTARSDIWESQYLCGGYRMKKFAKRVSKRANRRMAKAIITAEL